MSPHGISKAIGSALRGDVLLDDPGDGGTVALTPECAFQLCILKSSGVETRKIPAASTMPVGAMVLLVADTVGTSIAVSIVGGGAFNRAGTTSITLDANGGYQLHCVVKQAGANRWVYMAGV